MSVEFVVVAPVMLAIALVVCNASLFMSECAAFDRLSKDAVRSVACSPAHGQGTGACAGAVRDELASSFDKDYLDVEVQADACAFDDVRYTARLKFYPTLFGRSFSGNAFGVRVTPIVHETVTVVDPYQPLSFA